MRYEKQDDGGLWICCANQEVGDINSRRLLPKQWIVGKNIGRLDGGGYTREEKGGKMGYQLILDRS